MSICNVKAFGNYKKCVWSFPNFETFHDFSSRFFYFLFLPLGGLNCILFALFKFFVLYILIWTYFYFYHNLCTLWGNICNAIIGIFPRGLTSLQGKAIFFRSENSQWTCMSFTYNPVTGLTFFHLGLRLNTELSFAL